MLRNRNKTRALLAALAVWTMLAGSAPGAILAGYGFDGSSLASSDPSTDWETTDLDSGTGVPETINGSVGQPAPALHLHFSDVNDGTLQDDDYYTFTVTPDALIELGFTDFDFDINKQGTAETSGHLYSSIDGFSSEIGSAAVPAGTGQPGYRSWTTLNIDLSSLPAVTTATEFRLYLITPGSVGSNYLYLDNLTLTGEASVIPEPSSLLLAALGMGSVVCRRRRR